MDSSPFFPPVVILTERAADVKLTPEGISCYKISFEQRFWKMVLLMNMNNA